MGRGKRGYPLILTAICAIILLLDPLQGQAGNDEAAQPFRHQDPRELIVKGGYGVTRDGYLLASANLDVPLVPASIIKLLTTLAAFDQLGPDYRFKTEFFTDEANNLYIKGYGDPFLVSEEIETIMISLQQLGIRIINDIYIDDSSYQLESIDAGTGTSLNPYDVAPSALAVNFNTINIAVTADGSVSSAEPQTPLLPIMTRLGKGLPAGEHRINISGEPADVLRLTGQLFRSFQQSHGMPGTGRITGGKAPATPPLLRHYSSKTLTELVKGLLLYSNNFIANQLFLQIGAKNFGYPVTWDKGQRAIHAYLEKIPALNAGAIQLIEGSGLSRNNRITGRDMLRVLDLFKPHARLLPVKDGILLKSGTLTGVYSYAGYFSDKGRLDSFAIILNQEKNNRDEILRIVRKIYQEVVPGKISPDSNP